MTNFPGIALIIDDLFELSYLPPISDNPTNAVQQKSFIALRDYLTENCVPFATITKTDDAEFLGQRIEAYGNVRLLILDLDLNNDGDVGEDDAGLLFFILKTAVKKFGYFFLLINSSHGEKWEDLKKNLPDEISFFAEENSPVSVFDKNNIESINEKLNELKARNYSLDLIFDFEKFLNIARDQAFNGMIDSSKRTWNKIYLQIFKEAGAYANYIVSEMLLSLIKQYFHNCSYTVPSTDDPIDSDIAKKIFANASYMSNNNGYLDRQPIWTGNLYYIENPSIPSLHYALIITPECDIAQSRFITYQIACGYELNALTFPESYDPKNYANLQPPLHVVKAGKANGKWKNKENLNTKKNLIDHLYILPYASKNNKTVMIDFRDITFITENRIKNYTLIRRIGEPMITDILDKISAIFNRKGLLPILPHAINPMKG